MTASPMSMLRCTFMLLASSVWTHTLPDTHLTLIPRIPVQGIPNTFDEQLVLHNFTELLHRRAPPPNIPSIPGAIFQNLNDALWDQTPQTASTNAERNRVVDAWTTAKQWTMAAATQMQEIAEAIDAKLTAVQNDPQTTNLRINLQQNIVREWVAQTQPAYTQMFAADVVNAHIIADNFQTIYENVENLNAPNRFNQPLYLTKHPNPINAFTQKDECASGTLAFVLSAALFSPFQNIGLQFANNAMVINFCPPFFDNNVQAQASALFNDLRTGTKSASEVCNAGLFGRGAGIPLPYQGTTAQTMLHEWTHLPYTLDTNEFVSHVNGFEMCAARCVTNIFEKGGVFQISRFSVSSNNADTYANFAIYDLLNKMDECKGIHWNLDPEYEAGCADTWPSAVPKGVRNAWKSWRKPT